MAPLTSYLNGPSGGKAIIPTKTPNADLFGGVTAFANAAISAQPSAAEKNAVNKAAAEAREKEGMNLFVEGIENIMGGGVPPQIDKDAKRILKMQKAGASPIQIDASVQQLTKEIAAKYPDLDRQKLYAYLNDVGLDDFVYRDAKRSLEIAEKTDDAEDAAFTEAAGLVTKMGLPVERMTRSQVLGTARDYQKLEFTFQFEKSREEEWRAQQAEIRAQGSESRAIETHETSMDKSRREARIGTGVEAMMGMDATDMMSQVVVASQMTAKAINGEIPEQAYQDFLAQNLQALGVKKAAALSAFPGMSENHRAAINSQYDAWEELLISMKDNELSVNQRRLDQIAAIQSKNGLSSWREMPTVMKLIDIGGDAMVESLFGRGAFSEPVVEKATTEIANFYASLVTQDPLNPLPYNPDKFFNGFGSINPSDTASLETGEPAAYKTVTIVSSKVLPDMRSQLITMSNTASPHQASKAATAYVRAFSSIKPELDKLKSVPASDRIVRTTLKTLPVPETMESLRALYKSGSPASAEFVTRSVSQSYHTALNAIYNDYTSASVGSMLSPMKPGVIIAGRRAVPTPPKLTFNENTGRFQADGPAGGKVKDTVAQMNTLLDGMVESERLLGRVPGSISEVKFRNHLVLNTITAKNEFDQEIIDTLNEQGWPITSPGEVAMEVEKRKADEAKKTNGAPSTEGNLLKFEEGKKGAPKETTFEDLVNEAVKRNQEMMTSPWANANKAVEAMNAQTTGTPGKELAITGIKIDKISPRIEQYVPLIEGAASRYNLPPELITAVIDQESRGQKDVTSPAGAEGLMQLMPATAKDLGVTDSFDAAQNIDGGAKYLRQMLDRYGEDLEAALMAYNWGPRRVDTWIKNGRTGKIPAETADYLEKVLGRLERGEEVQTKGPRKTASTVE